MNEQSRFDGFKKSAGDARIEELIEQHCRAHKLSFVEAVHQFPVLARRQALKRFLAHVEFFELALDVPGDIAELGVFRGLGLLTWANLLEAYCIGSRTRSSTGSTTGADSPASMRMTGARSRPPRKSSAVSPPPRPSSRARSRSSITTALFPTNRA